MAAIPQDFLDRIRQLESRLRQLEGRSQIRPAMNEILNGNVTIGEGGTLRVRDNDGTSLFYVGKVAPDRPDGIDQQGLIARRDDGSMAFSVWTSDTSGNPVQPVRMFDHNGNVIVADDTKAAGLARPWIPYTFAMVNESTDSTDWSTLYQGWGLVQHPRMRAYLVPIPAGTPGGQIRLVVDEQVIATVTAPTAINTTFEVPDFRYGRTISYRIEARRTGSAARVYARPYYLYGVESGDSTELYGELPDEGGPASPKA